MQTIRVTGKGILSIKPDTISLKFSASEQEKTYDAAVQASAKWTEKLQDLFKHLGFEKEDLKTTSLNIDGKYEWEKNLLKRQRKLVGYEYDLRMTIKFPADNERLGKIIYALSHSKLKPSFQIEYTVDDKEKAKEQLLELAVDDARKKAEILASAANQELVKVMLIDYSWGEVRFNINPINRMMPDYDDDDYYDCDYEDEEDTTPARSFFKRRLSSDEEMPGFNINVNPDDIRVENAVTMVWQIKESEN